MLFQESLAAFAAVALVGFARPAAAYTTACQYQEYKCGSELFNTDGT